MATESRTVRGQQLRTVGAAAMAAHRSHGHVAGSPPLVVMGEEWRPAAGFVRPTRGNVRVGSAKRATRRRGSGSRPVSRVLSKAVIHLRRTSPHACSDLPGSGAGHASSPVGGALPYLVLLRVGFTLPPVLPPARCALTAPFHPYLTSFRTYTAHTARAVAAPMRGLEAVCFLWHFPWARAPQALPGTLPFGARTFLRLASKRRLPGRLPQGTV